ncbi:4Fe-4S binding protein [Methanocaldococcus infernus]
MLKFLIKHLFFNNNNKEPTETEKIKLDNCICCELCLSVCPTEAISLFKYSKVICEYCKLCEDICKKKYCESCGYCSLFCPLIYIKNLTPKPKTPVIDKKSCVSCGLCSCEAIDIKNKKIDEDKCNLCLSCVEKCPMLAIKTPEEYVKSLFIKVDYDKCIFCRACEEICPIKNLEKE